MAARDFIVATFDSITSTSTAVDKNLRIDRGNDPSEGVWNDLNSVPCTTLDPAPLILFKIINDVDVLRGRTKTRNSLTIHLHRHACWCGAVEYSVFDFMGVWRNYYEVTVPWNVNIMLVGSNSMDVVRYRRIS